RREAHAVDGSDVGRVAAGAVRELDLLDPERPARRDAARGGAAVRIRRDHGQLDPGDLQQRPAHGMQASRLNTVVVGQQDLHRCSGKGSEAEEAGNEGKMMRTRLLLAVLAVALTASTGTAWAAFNFTDPVALPKSLPDAKGNTEMQGGEPSLAFDPSGDGHLYSVAPGGQGPGGVNFWGSADNGVTWQYARAIGSGAGGGDSDVDVG